MKNNYIFFIFIFIFLSGCSQKNYYINSEESYEKLHSEVKELSKQYDYDQKLHNHHSDIQELHSEIEELLELYNQATLHYEITGNNKIGKVNMSYYKSSFSNNSSHDSDSYNNKETSLNKEVTTGIKSHSYQTINSIDELKNLKNTVTYVLFPRNLVGQNKKTKKYKRYAKILELIQELKKQ